MTDKPQELYEIEQVIRSVLTPNSYIVPQEGIELTKAILDWHNKQVEEVLDRLLDGTTTIHLDTQPNNPVEGKIEPMLFKTEIKAAIEAERNKLKESK